MLPPPLLFAVSLGDLWGGISLPALRQAGRLHVFSVFGEHFAYDAASGTLHRVDAVAKAILEQMQSGQSSSLKTVLAALSGDFSLQDIETAFHEVAALVGTSLWIEDPNLSKPREPNAYLRVPVKSICLNVVHDCNLSCSYCFAAQGRFGGKPEIMSKAVARAAVDFLIRSSARRRFLDLDFFGGEPLLAFDVIEDTMRYAREKGKQYDKEFRFTLTTNCVLLTPEIATYLARENISLILSIDGRPEVHDRMRVFRGGQPSHAVVLANAKEAVEIRGGKDYWVRGTFTRHNLDFHNDVRYLYEAGFRHISLEPAVGEGEWSVNQSHLEEVMRSYASLVEFWAACAERKDPFFFYHFNLGLRKGMCLERRETGCGAGYEYVAVTPSGEIFACHELVGKNEYRLGDVYEGITNDRIRKMFYNARAPNKPTCMACWARYLCGGGCHAAALASTGSLGEPAPLTCELVKRRMEYALYVEYISAMRLNGGSPACDLGGLLGG